MDLHGDVVFSSEASADGSLNHSDVIHVQIQRRGDLAPVAKGILGSDQDIQDPGRIQVGQARLRLHRHMVHPLSAIRPLDDHIRIPDCLIDVALAHFGVLEDIASFVDRRSCRVERILDAENGS